MCEECLQSMDHTGSAPAHGGTCFLDLHCSGFRLLSRVTVQSGCCVLCTSQVWAAQVQVLGYSTGAQTQLCMCFVPFPGPSSSGNQLLGEHTVPRGPCILITFPVPGTWFPRCIVRALSQVCHVSPLGSWSQAVTLLADVNRSGSQEDLVSNWEPAHSLVEDAGLWGWEWSSPLPSSSGCHLPASLPPAVGEGPVCIRLALLWYSLNPLFCEKARLCLRLEPFAGKFFFFFLFSFSSLPGYPTVWVAISG